MNKSFGNENWKYLKGFESEDVKSKEQKIYIKKKEAHEIRNLTIKEKKKKKEIIRRILFFLIIFIIIMIGINIKMIQYIYKKAGGNVETFLAFGYSVELFIILLIGNLVYEFIKPQSPGNKNKKEKFTKENINTKMYNETQLSLLGIFIIIK
jgi:hypothetical protein